MKSCIKCANLGTNRRLEREATETLLTMSETHKRVGSVCHKVILKRQKEYEEKKKEEQIQKIQKEILRSESSNEVAKFVKYYPGYQIVIDVILGPIKVGINQIFFKPDAETDDDLKPVDPNIPWILLGVEYELGENTRFALVDRTSNAIREISEALFKYGYEISP